MKKKVLGLVIVALSVLAVQSSFADDQLYYIEGDAPAGTKFKVKELVSRIPLNKAYHALTERQQQIFRENYAGIPDSQIPPFPSKGLESIYLPILEAHRRMPRDGEIFAIAIVDGKGRTRKVDVYKAPNQTIAQIVSAVLFETKFDAGVCDGKPCAMEFPLEMKLQATIR
ncbi:hypothetical protein [Simiduia aestuariiviva]|uniref:TonB C-terminal domain-containing protein n=1 Tax=Simiduia aestuariiviva TaxID=1510459 RepID=A0A839UMC9_9GAMM|nr:hypothetical protein [Simiduia aestuariiviva]MBB3166896.1 hypothetical protein [Simiduia aestuariiviva]